MLVVWFCGIFLGANEKLKPGRPSLVGYKSGLFINLFKVGFRMIVNGLRAHMALSRQIHMALSETLVATDTTKWSYLAGRFVFIFRMLSFLYLVTSSLSTVSALALLIS